MLSLIRRQAPTGFDDKADIGTLKFGAREPTTKSAVFSDELHISLNALAT
ncbi:MAG: hypothetical protein Q8K71_09645 [Polaromonas sp.]|nr:hypothetical protein [Polaromonas sp.]MDP3750529.1 hypothetical protein [Polaromonas sp.]